MTTNKIFGQQTASVLGMGLLCGFAVASVQGCDDGGPLGNLAEQCGLVCSAEGIVEGNASISGVASVDAFFSAVIDVRNAALNISGSFRAELEGMAAQLGVDTSLETPELAAAVKAAIDAKISAAVDGGIQIKFQPPKCEADIEVTAKAAAECDVEADPGMIEAKCSGTCEVSAEVAAECSAMGNLRCEGQAPNFECSGTCSGSCQLEAAAACEGSCNGECDGGCSACAGGACDTSGGLTANCAGTCDGMCRGECKLEAGGSCSGRCEGSCEYNPGMAMCEANATAKCDASAMADVECSGKCEGSVTPPMVKAECSASVEAKAKAEVVCTPPSLTVDFQFSAAIEGDANAKAEFKAWLEGFKARFSAMLAIRAKADILVEAIAGLTGAASGAVRGAVDAGADAAADGDLKVAVGLGCALTELEAVGTALGSAGGELQASGEAFVMISSSVAP
jgi:hypothetical protein